MSIWNGKNLRKSTGGVDRKSERIASSGKGSYDNSNLGGHTTDNGDGTSTTTDNRGSVTHTTGDKEQPYSGAEHGGNNGGYNGTPTDKAINLSLFPEAQASMAMGAPSTLSLFDGMWGFALLKSKTVQETVAEALAKIKPMTTPVASMLWRGSLWGLVIEAVTPTKIAPDDMSMVRHITTALPASMVTQTPFSQLPTQPTALATARVTDVVQNGQQKIAVVRAPSLPISIPVIAARPTNRSGVFTASVVSGMPDFHINIGTQSPSRPQKPAEGVQEVKNSPVFQQSVFTTGGHTHDAIVYFPPEAKTDPVYISVTPVLTERQIKELQKEYQKRQAQWDARHPVEVAERQVFEADETLKREQGDVNLKQVALDRVNNTPEGLTLANPAAHPITSTSQQFLAVTGYSGGGVHFEATATIDNKQQLDQLINLGGMAYVKNVLQWGDATAPNTDGIKVGNGIKNATAAEYDKVRQRILDRQKEINNALASLSSAIENRNHAEQGKKNAESHRDKVKGESKNKPTDFTIDNKIKGQMDERGWTEQDIRNIVAKGPKGISVDQRRPKTTEDGLGRNDPATVYGEPGKYVVINDRTNEVTQVSGKNVSGWIDDSRIFWGNNK